MGQRASAGQSEVDDTNTGRKGGQVSTGDWCRCARERRYEQRGNGASVAVQPPAIRKPTPLRPLVVEQPAPSAEASGGGGVVGKSLGGGASRVGRARGHTGS